MPADFVITRATPVPLETVCQRLPEISTAHRFGVLGVHNLREKMESKGVAFGRECRVFEVCNPGHAQKVLGQNIAISTALPCRIAVYAEGGQTILATIRPTALLTMFDARTNLNPAVEREVRNHFQEVVYKTLIPRTVRFAEAPSHGRTIFEHDPNGIGSTAYRKLAAEFLQRQKSQLTFMNSPSGRSVE